MALTSPCRPVALINFDRRLEALDWSLIDPTDIMVMELDSGVDLSNRTDDEYEKAWQRFVTVYKAALEHAKTVIVDTGTEAWELCRLAFLGRLAQVPPVKYGIPNAAFRQLVREAERRPDVSLILIHKLKAEYINDRRTGEYVMSGFHDIPYMVQVNLHMERRDGKFGFVIPQGGCTFNTRVEGMEFYGPLCNLGTLYNILFGEEEGNE